MAGGAVPGGCAMVFALATPFADGATFPRGPGGYVEWYGLAAVVLVYLCWVKTCWWVDRDARETKQRLSFWNPLLLGCGLFGLLAVWFVPHELFWLSFAVLLLAYLGPALMYVRVRNDAVTPSQRVLTPRHLRELANRWLRLGLKGAEAAGDKDEIPIRFISKN